MKFLKPKRIKLAQSMPEFEEQALNFLQDNGFPVDPDHLAMYGAFVSHSDQMEDSIDPVELAKAIRKSRANQLAFYLIHPDKKPKEETKAAVAANEHADETQS